MVPNPRKPSRTGKIRTGAWWECRCDCGTVKLFTSQNLRSENSQSCGCLHREQLAEQNRRLKAQEPWLADMLKYQRSLEFPSSRKRNGERNRPWELDLETYRRLVTSNCFYCGDPPKQKPLSKQMQSIGEKRNGIDRVDNAKGYITNNCVTCCANCNREKRSQTQAEFIANTKRRYDHLVSKGLL